MIKPKSNHKNKFIKILTIPIRALAKARDFYVNSMNNYAYKVHYGPAPESGSAGYSVPRSFSTTSMRSSDDDFKELVRAASTSTLGSRIDLSSSNVEPKREDGVIKRVPRSASVGMAKIEEDKPFEFDVNYEVVKKEINNNNNEKFRLFPRSRSYAVGDTNRSIPSAF